VADGTTVTPAEHAVLEQLRRGPAALGPRTETYEVRRVTTPLWAVPPTDAPVQVQNAALDERTVEVVRTVESKAARRLERAGLVTIVAGEARIVDQ
jgi:hypothetical protein